MTEFIEIENHKQNKQKIEKINWKEVDNFIEEYCDKSVSPIDWVSPGCESSFKVLQDFLTKKLDLYADKRNDPTLDICSNLSPFLHYGQVLIFFIYIFIFIFIFIFLFLFLFLFLI